MNAAVLLFLTFAAVGADPDADAKAREALIAALKQFQPPPVPPPQKEPAFVPKAAPKESFAPKDDAPSPRKEKEAPRTGSLVFFGAEWCGPCKKMKAETLAHPGVKKALGDRTLILCDAGDKDMVDRYAKHLEDGIPAYMLVDADGRVEKAAFGFKSPDQMLVWLGVERRVTRTPFIESWDKAMASGKPLLIWNGVKAQRDFSENAVIFESEKQLPGRPKGLVICLPHKGKMAQAAVLNGPDIRAADVNKAIDGWLKGGTRQNQPLPFRTFQLIEAGVSLSSVPPPRPSDLEPVEVVQRDAEHPATGPWLSDEEQERIRGLWPADVEFPEGLRFYQRTNWTQLMFYKGQSQQNPGASFGPTVLAWPTNMDQHFANAVKANPNREFPWAVPGGLEKISPALWRSYVGVRLPGPIDPPVTVKVNVTDRSGTQVLPKKVWKWQDDTMFVDLLTNPVHPEGEKVFEVRVRDKEKGKWDHYRPFKDKEAAPVGYSSKLVKRCVECHEKAIDAQYNVNVRRMDTIFSASPLVPGKLEADHKHWPILGGDL